MKKLLSLLLALVAFPAAAQIPGGGGNIVIGAPVTGCSNSGYVIYNNGGLVGCEAAPSGGFTIGTTTITNGTSLRFLYDLAGVVQESADITLLTGGITLGASTGISRVSNGVVGVGNGTAGDFSGVIQASGAVYGGQFATDGVLSIYLGAAAAIARTATSRQWFVGSIGVNNTGVMQPSDGVVAWASFSTGAIGADVFGARDTGLSRISAGVVAIGSGATGDFSGTIQATNFTSGSTAGVTCSGVPSVSFASTNGIVTHC